jgi:hypothetical protein
MVGGLTGRPPNPLPQEPTVPDGTGSPVQPGEPPEGATDPRLGSSEPPARGGSAAHLDTANAQSTVLNVSIRRTSATHVAVAYEPERVPGSAGPGRSVPGGMPSGTGLQGGERSSGSGAVLVSLAGASALGLTLRRRHVSPADLADRPRQPGVRPG